MTSNDGMVAPDSQSGRVPRHPLGSRPETRSLWRQKSTWVFLGMAFGVPWAGWTTANLLASSQGHSALLTWLFYTGDFCTLAGFGATFLDAGWAGVRDLLRRCTCWRVRLRWWIYALFLPAIWTGIAAISWGLTHGGIGRVRLLQVAALLAPVRFVKAFSTGPLGEESGWRGFFLPKLLERYKPLTASLVLGIIWGVWHIPLYYSTMVAYPSLAARFLLSTVGYSVLITILFLHTRRSILLAMVLHYTINVWPPVLALMCPDVHMDMRGLAGWLSAGLMAAVALGFTIFLGPQLGQPLQSNVARSDTMRATAPVS